MTLAVRHGNQRHSMTYSHGYGSASTAGTGNLADGQWSRHVNRNSVNLENTQSSQKATNSNLHAQTTANSPLNGSAPGSTPLNGSSSQKHRQLLHERYSVIGDLNQGSYGKVCLVKDIASHNQLKAVKCIKAVKNESLREAKERASKEGQNKDRKQGSSVSRLSLQPLKVSTAAEVETEIRIHKQLGNHTNIARLLDHFESDDMRYLVMEYYSGGDLYEAIKASRGPKEQGNIYGFMSQLIAAVEYAHSKNVYHRDIKPENILIAGNGTVKLSDWGLSTTDRYNMEFGVGSERYMAPELFDEAHTKRYDASKVDIWALGICLLNILFGKNPFTVACHKDKLFMDFSTSREALFDIFPTLSPDVFAVLRHCLTMDPDNRSLKAMKEELAKVDMWTTDDFDYQMDSDTREESTTATTAVEGPGPSSVPDFVCTNDRKPFRVPSVMHTAEPNNSASFKDWNRTSLFTPPVNNDSLANRKSFQGFHSHHSHHQHNNSLGGSSFGHSFGRSYGRNSGGRSGHPYSYGSHYASGGHRPSSIYETEELPEQHSPEEELSNDEEFSFEASHDDHDDVFAMDQDHHSSMLVSQKHHATQLQSPLSGVTGGTVTPTKHLHPGADGNVDRNSSDSSVSSVPSLVPNNYKTALIDAATRTRTIPIRDNNTSKACYSKPSAQSVGGVSNLRDRVAAQESAKAADLGLAVGGRSVPGNSSTAGDFWKFNKSWGDYDFDDDEDSETDEFYEMLAASLPKSSTMDQGSLSTRGVAAATSSSSGTGISSAVDSGTGTTTVSGRAGGGTVVGGNSSTSNSTGATSNLGLTEELTGKFEDVHISVANVASPSSRKDPESWLMTSQWTR